MDSRCLRLRSLHAQRGFTLPELMVALAILAIAFGLMLPSFQALMANQRVRSAANALATSVMYARTEAIKRHAIMEITSKDDDWSTGWSINVKGSSVVLRSESLSGIVVSGLEDATLSLGKSGRLAASVTATLCDTYNRAKPLVVSISFSGQTRVSEGGSCGS